MIAAPGTARPLERDEELEALAAALATAAGGQGVGIALVGESGAGKSTVIATALREAHGMRVLRGQCEPLSTPRPLGPFRDLRLAVLDGSTPDEAQLARQVLDELAAEPSVLVVEDLHWLDAASAELLRYLCRRVETLPLALLVSYRDLEIGAHHPARQLLGDFAVLDGLSTLALRPLSVDAVAEAVAGTELDPRRVHELTGGNPFFVSQVAREPDRRLPASVRDAVLAQIAEVEPDDLEILQLIACAPDRLDDRVLPVVGVDLPTLRRLDKTTLLARTEHGLVFRHELARQAVESTIPPGGSTRLHLVLLDALEQLDRQDPATLTHHAVAARDAGRAHAHALAAADEAAHAESNTEAAAFLEIALEHLPSRAPVADRAELLTRLGVQLYLAGRSADSVVSLRASIPLWEGAGRLDRAGEGYAWMAGMEYLNGRRQACEAHAQRSRELADRSGSAASVALAYSMSAQVAFLGSDLPGALRMAERAHKAAVEIGDESLVLASRTIVDGFAFATGDVAARTRLVEAIDQARRHRHIDVAWRGYSLLTLTDLERGDQRILRDSVEATIEMAIDHDLGVGLVWHRSLRAVVHAAGGRWQAAREDAEAVLASTTIPEGAVWPHLALAMTTMRTGVGDPLPHLEDLWSVARGVDEPLRYLHALSAWAEHAWFTGRPHARLTEFAVPRLADLATSVDCRYGIGALAVWLRRAGVPVEVPCDVPDPYRLQLEGRHADAAGWWQRATHPFNEAMAYADSPEPDDRVRAVQLLDRLGATGTADRLRAALRADGLEVVPQRPRESTRANPGGLTNRQLDVARLVARGLSNNEIATRLFISPKTADHHVSAILAKLGLPNRRAVVVQAPELGLD